MDFVVYGTGYGATLMLLGYALRTWGPKWRLADHNEDAYDYDEFRTARSAWTRFTEGLGAAIATGGAVLVIFTFLLMLLNPGDDVGVMVCLIVSAATLIGVAAWAWMYFDRYGSWGVLRMPEPLTSYQPLRYDPNVRHVEDASEAAPEHEDEAAEEETAPEDAAVVAVEEIEARATKFATHHPDGEMEVGTYRERGVTTTEPEDTDVSATEDVADAESTPENAGEVEPQVDDAAEAVEPGTETAADTPEDALTTDSPTETSDEQSPEDVADIADDEADVTEDPVVEEPVPVTVAPDSEDTSAEVVDPAPEAHEPEAEADRDAVDVTAGDQPGGGRDEALRRLRERRSQRTGGDSGEPDDA